MIREGTRGAEGKNKGNERKELDQHRKFQRRLKKIRNAKTHWKIHKANQLHFRQGHKDIIADHRNVVELPSARVLRKICSKRNSKRKVRGKVVQDRQTYTSSHISIVPRSTPKIEKIGPSQHSGQGEVKSFPAKET